MIFDIRNEPRKSGPSKERERRRTPEIQFGDIGTCGEGTAEPSRLPPARSTTRGRTLKRLSNIRDNNNNITERRGDLGETFPKYERAKSTVDLLLLFIFLVRRSRISGFFFVVVFI